MRSLSWALLLGMVLLGCSLSPPAVRTDVNGGTFPQKMEVSVKEVKQCGPADLTGSMCSGPWEYQEYNACTVQDLLLCGEDKDQCVEWKECRDISFGTEIVTRTRTVTIHAPAEFDPETHQWICPENPCDDDSGLESSIGSNPDQNAGNEMGTQGGEAAPKGKTCTYRCKETYKEEVPKLGRGRVCGCPEDKKVGLRCDVKDPDVCGNRQKNPGGLSTRAGLLYSESGLTNAELHAKYRTNHLEPREGGKPYDAIIGERCTTCEDLPADTPDQVRAKFVCLENRLRKGPVAVSQTVILHMKELWELNGEQLTKEQQEAARQLYIDYKEAENTPACGVTPIVSVPPVCAKDAQRLMSSIGRCQRLISGHVKQSLRDQEASSCLELMNDPAALAEDDCGHAYRATVAALVFDKITPANAMTENISGLDESLRAIDQWHNDAVKLWKENPEKVRARDSRLLRRFWQRVQDVAAPLPQSFSQDYSVGSVQLTDLLNDGQATDRQVLTAAFSDRSPLQSTPLLYLLADGLQPLVERLQLVSPLHDLGCRFNQCDPKEPTELSELWGLIATLHDGPELKERVLHATATQKRHPEHWNLFKAFSDHHDLLQKAFFEAEGPNKDMAKALEATTGIDMAGLRHLIEQAVVYTEHFNATGLFGAGDRNTLEAGLQNNTQEYIIKTLTSRRDRLDNAKGEYKETLHSWGNDLLNEISRGGYLIDIANRTKLISARINDAINDLNALRHREGVEANRISQLRETFDQMRKAGSITDMQMNEESMPLNISAGNARFSTPGQEVDDVARVAAQNPAGGVIRMSVQPRDIVSISVTGNWAPNCALTKARLATPYGDTRGIQLGAPYIGSEGYSIDWSKEGYKAHSVNTQDSDSWSKSENREACAGFDVKVPIVKDILSFGASAKACQGSTKTPQAHSHTTTDDAGSSDRWSARFSGGMRLPTVPFPQAPVGALLAVATKSGDSKSIQQVHVVTANTMLVFDKAMDLYLVVNDLDKRVCPNPDTSRALGGIMARSTPVGALVSVLSGAMVDTLPKMREKLSETIDKGPLLQTELAAIASEADAVLRLRLSQHNPPLDLDQFPASLRILFKDWVDKEIASLDRRGQMLALERQMDSLLLELQALADDLANAEDQGRLSGLLPRWTLRSLTVAENKIPLEIDSLVDYTSRFTYPLLRLLYPDAIEGLRTSRDGSDSLNGLINLDFNGSPEAMADSVLAFLNSLLKQIENAKTKTHFWHAPVMIAFPRPNIEGRGPFDPGDTEWLQVDPARAKRAWDGISIQKGADGKNKVVGSAVFEIQPDDLYRRSGSIGVLFCNENVPVIETMALYAVTEDSNNGIRNGEPRYSPGIIDPVVYFPDTTGNLRFGLQDANLYKMRGKWLFGSDGEASDIFQEWTAKNEILGEGRSPFTTFSFDIGDGITEGVIRADELENITAFILIFKLNVRNAQDIEWIPRCKRG